jgi:hypothetical protein
MTIPYAELTESTNYKASPEFLTNVTPHSEISNRNLKLFYVMNIVMAILAIALAAGQIATTNKCNECASFDSSSADNYANFAYFVIVFSIFSFLVATQALVRKLGMGSSHTFSNQDVSAILLKHA